jgi:hypothetical protein
LHWPIADGERLNLWRHLAWSRHANNSIEADHGRLKARLLPMRGLKHHRSARVFTAGHAFVQNLRRSHYDIAAEIPGRHRLRIAFDELALAMRVGRAPRRYFGVPGKAQRNSAS